MVDIHNINRGDYVKGINRSSWIYKGIVREVDRTHKQLLVKVCDAECGRRYNIGYSWWMNASSLAEFYQQSKDECETSLSFNNLLKAVS